MKNSMFGVSIIAAFLLMNISCASVQASKAEETIQGSSAHMSNNYSLIMPKIKSIGILTDICVAEDMGELLVDESIQADSLAASGISGLAQKNGYRAILSPGPYVGAYMAGGSPAPVRISGKGVEMNAPFALPDISKSDNAYNQALMYVINTVAKTSGSNSQNRSELFRPDEKTLKALSLIAERTSADALFVVIGQGLLYNRDENLAQDSGTGINLTYHNNQTIQIIDDRRNDIQCIAALIHLKSGSLVWSDEVQIEMPEVLTELNDFFKTKFAETLMKEFPQAKNH
jgi:hypothetical protein